MKTAVIDIETKGMPWDELSSQEQDYLIKNTRSPEEVDDVISKLALHALTAKIVSIAMYNPDSGHGKVYYEAHGNAENFSDTVDPTFDFLIGDETFIVKEFWSAISHFDTIVTFNGRGFDVPFIMMRSMILRQKPSKNLLPARYHHSHIDLLDTLTFFGATRKFNLDFYCRRLGITSPKTPDVAGSQVGAMYDAGKLKEIAIYNKNDVVATAKLYALYKEFMHF